MRPEQFVRIKQDITNILTEKKTKAVKQKREKTLPKLERINGDVPYLTEEKLEEAYLSSTISEKTEKLLQWLQIKENFDDAVSYYQNNIEKFPEIESMLQTRNSSFNVFVKHLINKHISQ